MSNKPRKNSPRDNRRSIQDLPGDHLARIAPRQQRSQKPLQALTPAQASLINAINVYTITFATGEFGTGKTYVPAAMAADAFLAGAVDKILISRPSVGCDEDLGFLPGDLDMKIAPWAKPVVEVLIERMGAGHVEYLLQADKIEIAPLAFLRGRTFTNSFVMLDEAQNTTARQMKLFLSRIGKGTKMVIDGDLEQTDLPAGTLSGLKDGLDRMRDHPQVGHVHFNIDDIVRSGIARDICIRYSNKDSTVGQAELGRFLARG